jgi:2,5-furandicarboxylate decarboxylase 1
MRDLRGYLEELEECGHLLRITKPVDSRHELAAVQWTVEKKQGKAVLFENVNGYDTPVVGNLFLIPYRMGITPVIPYTDDLLTFYQTIKKVGIVYPVWAANDMFLQLFHEIGDLVISGMRNPLTPKVVDDVPDLRLFEGDQVDLLGTLPIPHYYREDAGHYVTVGVLAAKDPETGIVNAGIYRIQVVGRGRLAAMVNLKRDLRSILAKAQRLGRRVEVVLAIGVAPPLLIAATMSVPFGQSEYDVAGGLAGEPLCVRAARTVDLPVPADSEIIIEGYIEPGPMVREGPFTEYDLLASQQSDAFPIEVTCIQRREGAIYHSLVCPSQEMLSMILPLGITEMFNARNFLQHITPNVKGVWLLPGVSGVGLVVSIYKAHDAEPQEVIHSLFAFSARFKRIVVVDDDVDIYDPYDVQWAIDTRVAYEKDVAVLSATGEYTDPARLGDFSVKLGIDATRKRGHPNRFTRSDLSQFDVDLTSYATEPAR